MAEMAGDVQVRPAGHADLADGIPVAPDEGLVEREHRILHGPAACERAPEVRRIRIHCRSISGTVAKLGGMSVLW